MKNYKQQLLSVFGRSGVSSLKMQKHTEKACTNKNIVVGSQLFSEQQADLYLDLLVRCDGAEDDLREALSGKHPETNATDDAAVFDEGEGLVLPVKVEGGEKGVRISSNVRPENSYLRVKHQSGDVLFGHAR